MNRLRILFLNLYLKIFILSLISCLMVWPASLFSCVRSDELNNQENADQASMIDISPILNWRNIGPARVGGYITDLAAPVPHKSDDPSAGIVLYAAAPGGLFKTEDGGTNWTSLFDRESVAAVHTVSISPSNPDIVWAGTGFPHFTYGMPVIGLGVFKSLDGGINWTCMGLQATEYISRTVIHPDDPNIVYVGGLGSLTQPSRDRGVYKSIDGGQNWSRVFFVNEWTGIADLVMDPSDQNILYAAAYQRAGNPYGFIDHGPGSGLYKTADGGKTWRKLLNGLPQGMLGRCGLAITPADPQIIYTVILRPVSKADGTKVVEVYRSEDRGESWVRKGSPAMPKIDLFGRIWADPKDANRIYIGGQSLNMSDDGGQTFKSIAGPKESGNADQHAMWINPLDPRHLVVGDDRGIWISQNRGMSWRHIESLTLMQTISVAADRRKPFYYLFGSARDHWGYGGPSRTRNVSGIPNDVWTSTPSIENFSTAIDPVDNSTLYAGGNNGLLRYDLRTDIPYMVGPNPAFGEKHEPRRPSHPGGPVVLSPFDHNTIYTGTIRIWKSMDRGDSWRAISPIFASQPAEGINIMGIRSNSIGDTDSATISALSLSPLEPNLLYAGTSNGLIAVSSNAGAEWKIVRSIPEVLPGSVVSGIVASAHHPGTAYVSFSAIKAGSCRPYVFMTTDYGENWTLISSNLPDRASVWDIVEHFRTPSLLFVGTDIGVFFSIDRGVTWRSMRGSMPAVRVTELLIHPDANDLVAATWGRGIFILDDITPLEHLDETENRKQLRLFPIRPVVHFYELKRGGKRPGPYSERPFAAPNPPYGALITYFVPSDFSNDKAWIEVRNDEGQTVRHIDVLSTSGFHRTSWDLRWDSPFSITPTNWRPWREVDFGPLVKAGTYQISLMLKSKSSIKGKPESVDFSQTVKVDYNPEIPLSSSEQDAEVEMRLYVHKLLVKLGRTIDEGMNLLDEVRSLQEELAKQKIPVSLQNKVDELIKELEEILYTLRGSGQIRKDFYGPWPLSLIVLHKGGIYGDFPPPPPPLTTRKVMFSEVKNRLNDKIIRLREIREQKLPQIRRFYRESIKIRY